MAGHSDHLDPDPFYRMANEGRFTGHHSDTQQSWPDVDHERARRVEQIIRSHPDRFKHLHLVHKFPEEDKP